MKVMPLLITISLFCQVLTAQETALSSSPEDVVIQLFDAMYAADSATVRSLFRSDARLQSVSEKADGNIEVHEGELDDFFAIIGTYPPEVLKEKIWQLDTRVDGGLATVWMNYAFYVSNNLSHCGVNAFHLVKSSDTWQILQITDTRQNENCIETSLAHPDTAHAFINHWHHAAAVADADSFYNAMAEDCIYIGTDKSERWLRDELREWATFAFDRESAWAFTPKEREVYFSENEQLFWWEELLGTQMGDCRGSGVAAWRDGRWQIVHYHLSVTVPNDKIEDFIELVKG